MSSQRVLVVAAILIAGQCVWFADAADGNVTDLAEKQRADTEIARILYGEKPQALECLNLTSDGKSKQQQRSPKKPDRSCFTVVLLNEVEISNQTIHIQHCAGSLIHPKVVLTAAHCVYKKNLSELRIRAGECARKPEKNLLSHQERRIQSAVYQKDYTPLRPKKDIALIFVKEPFEIVGHVKLACLPPPRQQQYNSDYLRCAAFGWERKPDLSPVHVNFKKLDLSVIPRNNCEQALRMTGLGEEFILHKSFMCAAGGFHKRMLEANGGAPLVCPACEPAGRVVQFGVMSWGFRNGPLPDVFASVGAARRWIVQQLQQNGLKLADCRSK